MAFNFPLKFPTLPGSSPDLEENPVQSDKTDSTGLLSGFPFVNYGEQRYKALNALVLPRPKYTWFAEFDINQDYLSSDRLVTNLDTFLQNNNNRIYLNLKRIDHPKPNMNFETLRSYNKYVKSPTKVEYPPAQMTLDDDSTSTVIALWKEYFAFYSHTGDIGFEELLNSTNLVRSDEDYAFAYDENMGTHGYGHLVSSEGTEPRRSMDIRASIGMRLKPNQHRHFFDRIVLYDLGTEPDSVNVYYYYRPVITSFDHGDADWEDRTSKIEANVTFEYENYYFALGIPTFQVSEVIERVTGVKPVPPLDSSSISSSSEHAVMETPSFSDIPPVADNSLQGPKPVLIGNEGPPPEQIFDQPEDPPPTPLELQREKDRVQREYQRLLRRCSSAQDSPDCRKKREQFEQELDSLDEQIFASQSFYSRVAEVQRTNPSTADAQRNTEEGFGLTTETPGTEDTVVKQAQVEALISQRNQISLSRDKVQNTNDALIEERDDLEQQLESSDEGELTQEGYPFNTFDRVERAKVEDRIESLNVQIADTERQLDLIDRRLEQIDGILDNVTSS